MDKKPTWEVPAAEEAARKAAYRKALKEEVEAGNEAVAAAVRKAYTAWLAAQIGINMDDFRRGENGHDHTKITCG